MSERKLRPKATASIAIAPATVTDLTAAQVLGLEPRPFRELLVREAVRHARVGQRVIARVEDVLAALDSVAERQRSGADSERVEDERKADEDGPGVNGLLARIGRRRVVGGRQ